MNIVQNSIFLSNLLRSSPVFELKYDHSCELYRMSTYSTFPAGVPVSERSLARAGFYYTGAKDRVRCFCCGLMLDNWKAGDSPTGKHRNLYPSCSFIQNLSAVSTVGAASQPPAPLSEARSTHAQSPGLERSSYFSASYSSFPVDPVDFRPSPAMSPWRAGPSCVTMKSEEDRLCTFQGWPLAFPLPSALARAGFYYVGPGDRVACFACGGKLSNWEPDDDALSEHLRHFPDCPFVEGQLQATVRYTASNLSMQTLAARSRTFCNWPPRAPVHPEQLASAGFYYMGHSDDVKCFCCDGGLRCWESGDDPWVEHAKWFPRCEYLIRIKGQEFISQIQASYPHLLEQLLSTSDNTEDENTESPNDVSLIRKNKMVLFQHLTYVLPILDSLLRAGVLNEQEHSSIKQKARTSLQARELIDTVLVKGSSAVTIFKNSLQEIDPMLYKRFFVQQDRKYIPTEDISDLPVEEQLRRLQEERTCKVCMDKEVSIVFIPCGHLVVCRDCAPSLRKCPICRGTVRGTVRTFLS
ncbi:baculoviral IAP repeat-containing protein 3 isoform X2 [Canis aureus]